VNEEALAVAPKTIKTLWSNKQKNNLSSCTP